MSKGLIYLRYAWLFTVGKGMNITVQLEYQSCLAWCIRVLHYPSFPNEIRIYIPASSPSIEQHIHYLDFLVFGALRELLREVLSVYLRNGGAY